MVLLRQASYAMAISWRRCFRQRSTFEMRAIGPQQGVNPQKAHSGLSIGPEAVAQIISRVDFEDGLRILIGESDGANATLI